MSTPGPTRVVHKDCGLTGLRGAPCWFPTAGIAGDFPQCSSLGNTATGESDIPGIRVHSCYNRNNGSRGACNWPGTRRQVVTGLIDICSSLTTEYGLLTIGCGRQPRRCAFVLQTTRFLFLCKEIELHTMQVVEDFHVINLYFGCGPRPQRIHLRLVIGSAPPVAGCIRQVR